MKKIIRNVVFLSLIILALSFAGCKDENVQEEKIAEEKENIEQQEISEINEKILIYISGPEEMINALEKDFEKDRGDVADFLIMSCGEVRSKVWTEKEAGKIQADVVLGSDPLIYNKLDKEGCLQDISNIENSEEIGEEYSSKEHNYLFVNERYITILYNENSVDKDNLPHSYKDLLKETYKGKITMADATQSSTALGIGSALYMLNGIEYFEKLNENNIALIKSNGQIPSLILEGQYDFGIGPHDSVVRIANKGKKEGYEVPVKIIWPEEGVIVLRRPISIIKDDERSQEKQNISEEFVNYFLSSEAQKITEKFGFVSVRKDLENKYLPEGVKKLNIDWDIASEKEEEFKDLYNDIFQN
jgi:iron(III) transport system substrate-binding protein